MENTEKRQELHERMRELNKRGNDSVTTNMQETEDNSVKIESDLIGDYESGPVVT